jgi:hypothetical protein
MYNGYMYFMGDDFTRDFETMTQMYKFARIDELTEQQKEWLEKYNGFVAGDGPVGDGAVEEDALKFFEESDVWFGGGTDVVVIPPNCRVVKWFQLGCLVMK